MHTKRKIYIAAPLFCDGELRFNANLKKRLSGRFDVWLPQEDGGLIVNLVAQGMPREAAVNKVFHMDVGAIRDCDVFIILLDGRVVDEGACFELGLAYSIGKLCIGLQTDVRRLLPTGNNPMLEAACYRIFASIKELECWADSSSVEGDLESMSP